MDIEDEKWLLRAIDVALQFFQNELSKNEPFRFVLFVLFVQRGVINNFAIA